MVQGEEGGFYKVEVDADLVGYVSVDYCKTQVEFDQAVSLEEERQRLAEENQRRQEAVNAIAALQLARQSENMNAGSGGSENINSGSGSQEILIAANPEQSDNSQQTSAPVIQAPGGAGAPVSGQAGTGTPVSGPGGAGRHAGQRRHH